MNEMKKYVVSYEIDLISEHGKRLALAACRALVDAYRTGEERGGSIDWSHLDDIHALALDAIRLYDNLGGEARRTSGEAVPVLDAETGEGSSSPETPEEGLRTERMYVASSDETVNLRRASTHGAGKPRLAIMFEGGFVERIVTDGSAEHPFLREIDVAVVDFDVEADDPEEYLSEVPQASGDSRRARVSFVPVLDSRGTLDAVFARNGR